MKRAPNATPSATGVTLQNKFPYTHIRGRPLPSIAELLADPAFRQMFPHARMAGDQVSFNGDRNYVQVLPPTPEAQLQELLGFNQHDWSSPTPSSRWRCAYCASLHLPTSTRCDSCGAPQRS